MEFIKSNMFALDFIEYPYLKNSVKSMMFIYNRNEVIVRFLLSDEVFELFLNREYKYPGTCVDLICVDSMGEVIARKEFGLFKIKDIEPFGFDYDNEQENYLEVVFTY